MRINKFIAAATDLSRRKADEAIISGRVLVDGEVPATGLSVTTQVVTLDGRPLSISNKTTVLLLNKPVGYVCSRDGQGSRTIFDLLAPEYQRLQPVGRLDKNSSGLLVLTDDGQLAYELTHPSFIKLKIYEVILNKPLQPLHRQMISDYGVTLEDGPSKLQLERLKDGNDAGWQVRMHEGRNRQIRRTFKSLGYDISRLHRIAFGDFQLSNLKSGTTKQV